MDPVVVPAPPKSSYNQNRRVSDLLYSQLKHFQHVAMKHGDLGIDPAIARNIDTEGGAAQYIAAVTVALRSKGEARAVLPAKLTALASPKGVRKQPAAQPLSIAASAAGNDASSATPEPAKPGRKSAKSKHKSQKRSK